MTSRTESVQKQWLTLAACAVPIVVASASAAYWRSSSRVSTTAAAVAADDAPADAAVSSAARCSQACSLLSHDAASTVLLHAVADRASFEVVAAQALLDNERISTSMADDALTFGQSGTVAGRSFKSSSESPRNVLDYRSFRSSTAGSIATIEAELTAAAACTESHLSPPPLPPLPPQPQQQAPWHAVHTPFAAAAAPFAAMAASASPAAEPQGPPMAASLSEGTKAATRSQPAPQQQVPDSDLYTSFAEHQPNERIASSERSSQEASEAAAADLYSSFAEPGPIRTAQPGGVAFQQSGGTEDAVSAASVVTTTDSDAKGPAPIQPPAPDVPPHSQPTTGRYLPELPACGATFGGGGPRTFTRLSRRHSADVPGSSAAPHSAASEQHRRWHCPNRHTAAAAALGTIKKAAKAESTDPNRENPEDASTSVPASSALYSSSSVGDAKPPPKAPTSRRATIAGGANTVFRPGTPLCTVRGAGTEAGAAPLSAAAQSAAPAAQFGMASAAATASAAAARRASLDAVLATFPLQSMQLRFEDVQLCRRPDGSLWKLGSGGYGSVRLLSAVKLWQFCC